MIKLSQLLAVEKGVKSRALAEVTALYHAAQKPALWGGITRTYAPKDDEGDQLPPESTRVQLNAEAHLHSATGILVRLMDVVATKDAANTLAIADVKVDGRVLLSAVPATTLLFLEKQLTDLRTFVVAIPELDTASVWEASPIPGVSQTVAIETTRSTKVMRNHIRAEATPQHPAQVDVFTEDVIVGTWTTRKLSGGLLPARKAELLGRVDALAEAVKVAREEANGNTEVIDVSIGRAVFDYVLA